MPQYDEAEGKSGLNEEANEILGDTTERSPVWLFACYICRWNVRLPAEIRPIDRQKNLATPCPNFEEYRFPGSSQITFPVNIICVFPNLAPYAWPNPGSRKYLKSTATKRWVVPDLPDQYNNKQQQQFICIGNSMICSDIWHKYHEWYFEIVIRNFTSR